MKHILTRFKVRKKQKTLLQSLEKRSAGHGKTFDGAPQRPQASAFGSDSTFLSPKPSDISSPKGPDTLEQNIRNSLAQRMSEPLEKSERLGLFSRTPSALRKTARSSKH